MAEAPQEQERAALIIDDAALTALCRRLREGEYLALDTEFVREKTYRPQPCLIQVAGGDAGTHCRLCRPAGRQP